MPDGPDRVVVVETVHRAVFRVVLGHFCSGVTIVTGLRRDTGMIAPVGFTCQSFASLSLDPPLVVFSVAHTSASWPHIRGTGVFGVNILSSQQESLGRRFGERGTDRFAGVAWVSGPATGVPLLAGSLAWLECTVQAVHPGGDHELVIGRVAALDVGHGSAEPLLFYRGAFRRGPRDDRE